MFDSALNIMRKVFIITMLTVTFNCLSQWNQPDMFHFDGIISEFSYFISSSFHEGEQIVAEDFSTAFDMRKKYQISLGENSTMDNVSKLLTNSEHEYLRERKRTRLTGGFTSKQISEGIDYFYWGNGLSVGPHFELSREINNLDKRDFDAFTKFVLRIIPTIYTSFSDSFNWITPFVFGEETINYEFVLGTENNRTAALAHSPLIDDIRIVINIDIWEELNNYERVWLLIHEFGHEAFGMPHGYNDLMYPLLPDELKDTRDEFFGGKEQQRNKPYWMYGNQYIHIENGNYKYESPEEHFKELLLGNKYSNIYDGFFGRLSDGTVSVQFNYLFDAIIDFCNSISEDEEFIKIMERGDYTVRGNSGGEIIPRVISYYYGYKQNIKQKSNSIKEIENLELIISNSSSRINNDLKNFNFQDDKLNQRIFGSSRSIY